VNDVRQRRGRCPFEFELMLYAMKHMIRAVCGSGTLTCMNNADATRKRVDMCKAQWQVRRAWKVCECDRLRCSTRIRQWDGLNVMMVG
jgi:hypothetical protein